MLSKGKGQIQKWLQGFSSPHAGSRLLQTLRRFPSFTFLQPSCAGCKQRAVSAIINDQMIESTLQSDIQHATMHSKLLDGAI